MVLADAEFIRGLMNDPAYLEYIGDILRESLEQESSTLAAYYELLKLTEGKSVALEEYAREMILLEEMHLDEVNKMLRKPGEIQPFAE